MKLTVAERFVLLGVLPAEGNFITLKIVRKFREALSFDEDEAKALGLTQDGERVTWNPDVKQEKEIPVGEKATDLIVAAIKKLDDEQKLTDQHYTLYEKFMAKADG